MVSLFIQRKAVADLDERLQVGFELWKGKGGEGREGWRMG
jgi:hypothetical protein